MKTMYDIVKEKLAQSRVDLDEKEVEQYENILKTTSSRELKDIIMEYDRAEKIAHINYQTIKFISYGDGGACGYAGEMYIVTKCMDEVKVYCFDCNDETPIEKFQLLLPWLCPFLKKFGSYYPNPQIARQGLKGWKHCYLGFGNHLFISDDIYPSFINEKIFLLINTGQLYKLRLYWKSKASDVLGVEI